MLRSTSSVSPPLRLVGRSFDDDRYRALDRTREASVPGRACGASAPERTRGTRPPGRTRGKNVLRRACGTAFVAAALVGAGQAQAAHPYTHARLAFAYGIVDQYTEDCDDDGCAEISAFDAASSRLFTTNGGGNALRILGVDHDGFLDEIASIDLSPYGGGPNSVAVSDGRVAVAVEAETATDPGLVVVFDVDGRETRTVGVGSLPDMLTFTPDGRYLLVANEGEPSDGYDIDPEGSISVIDTHDDWSVRTAGFGAFDDDPPENVRVFGPGASVSEDLEPEYIAVSGDSRTAWVSLQENNALAIVDVASATVTDVVGLGVKQHRYRYNALDTSDRDGGPDCRRPLEDEEQCIRIRRRPVVGMYQPDAIDTFHAFGRTFVISANEGDARDYDGFSEEARVGDDEIVLDERAYPNAARLKDDAVLGRLKTTTTEGDTDGDGDIDRIHAYGARSFSIWSANGRRVFDSGAEFERRLARFQARGADVWVDGRSDDKGPEPESVVVGHLAGRPIAFVGLERASGVFVHDLSLPFLPRYLGYIDLALFDDIAPEGLVFVERGDTEGLLIVTSEASNTVSTYEITLERRRGRRRSQQDR